MTALMPFPDGVTIHSAFNFLWDKYEQDKLSEKKRAEFRSDLQNLELVIVDEMSMITSDFLYRVHYRLTEIFQCDDLFANKSILLVGDLLQLCPVRGHSYIFQTPHEGKLALAADTLQLWQKFEAYVLKHNHRQGEGNQWANVLNEIREAKGILTDDTEELLQSRMIDMDEKNELSTCHIFYENKKVFDHNIKMLNKLPSELVELPAREFLPKGYTTQVKSYGTINNTKFMQTLQLKKGARVKLIWNVSTMDELTNGTLGTVIDFHKNSKGSVECIIVAFDSDTCGQQQRNAYSNICGKYKESNGTPIFHKEVEYYTAKRTGNRSNKAKVYQFPMILAWALTCHSMQVSKNVINEKYIYLCEVLNFRDKPLRRILR